jgi:hypothetical protein
MSKGASKVSVSDTGKSVSITDDVDITTSFLQHNNQPVPKTSSDNFKPTTSDRQLQTDNFKPTTSNRQLQTDNALSCDDSNRSYAGFFMPSEERTANVANSR